MRTILGQEAVVPHYGLGRVVAIHDHRTTVKTYADGIQRDYAHDNVKLVPLPKLEDAQ